MSSWIGPALRFQALVECPVGFCFALYCIFMQWSTRAARYLGAVAVAMCCAPAACSSGPDQAIANEPAGGGETGALALALTLGSGALIDRVDYKVTGPAAFETGGTINVSHSTTVAASIGPLPVGTDFNIALTATTTGGTTTCAGSSIFDVTGHHSTPVNVHLLCFEAARTGGTPIGGGVNVCPVVDGISASPAEVLVGAVLSLSAQAHDHDQGPSALSYHWTATSGVLSDASAAASQLTCTVPGAVTLSVTVSDGDNTPGCAATATATVMCTAGGQAVPVPATPLGWLGGLALLLALGGVSRSRSHRRS